ncbi:MAG: hypothetical protein ABUU24_05065, partial [Variovorax sp.]
MSLVLQRIHAARAFHTGIHPGLVVVDASGGGVTLNGLDQDVAHSEVGSEFRQAAMVGPAAPFVAPEQTGRLDRVLDYRADYYALGAVLYWMLAGRPPFPETEPLALLHALLTRVPPPP